MRHRIRLAIMLSILMGSGFLLTACARSTETPSEEGELSSPSTSQETPSPTALPGLDDPVVEPPMEQEIDAARQLAIATLAGRLGVDEAVIQLLFEVRRNWSSSAMGCPQPGQVYLDVITPGYEFTLGVDGQTYQVHVAGQAAIVCEAGMGREIDPPDPEQLALAAQQAEAARQDLAQRLGVEPDAIRILAIRQVVWPDGGLGCPAPGVEYSLAEVDGFLVELEHGGQRYEYHGDAQQIFLCLDGAPG